jgi:hypothetical protein
MSRATLAGVFLCVLTLVGCASIVRLSQLQAELDAAGYGTTNIDHNSVDEHSTLFIGTTMTNDVPTDEDAAEIAEIVWTRYPGWFDQLVISINGEVRLDATPAELTERFGERPEARTATRSGANVTAIVVVLVVAALFAVSMVLLWRRGRRTPPPVAPPAHPQMPNPYQYQPPPGGPHYS